MTPRSGRRRVLAASVLALVTVAVPGPVTAPVAAAAPACDPRPAWVDGSPSTSIRPAPGLTARTWRGSWRGVPLTVAAVEADTSRYGFGIATPGRLGRTVRTTNLVASSGAAAGMNGDYYVRSRAGILPKGVEVRDGAVLYAPVQRHRTVGADEQGRIVAGRSRVDGVFQTYTKTVKIGAVNAVGARAARVTAFTTYGARQPRQARWYVTVRDNWVIRSSARPPTKLRTGDVLLAAKVRSAFAGVRTGEPVTVRFSVRDVATGRLLTDAIGSGNIILRAGRIVADCAGSFGRSRRPRSVVAWDNDRRRIWLITANGRGSSIGTRGLAYGQVAVVARYLGATNAVLVDGGHSTTLAVRRGAALGRIDAAPGGPQRKIPDAVVLRPR